MHLDIGNRLELAYSILGQASGEGRTVLLLHGFTGCGASWHEITHLLVDSWRLLIPDLLGHGASSAPNDATLYRIDAAATHLALLLEQVVVEPVHVLGYSMGGRLALYFALKNPKYVRSLVLESASPGLETPQEREARCASDETLAQAILARGIEAFVKDWEAIPLFANQANLSDKVLQRQRQLRLANNPVGLAGSLRGMGTGKQPSLWDQLGNVSCPVLLMAGEHDVKFVGINQRMRVRIPRAALCIIPGAGHTTHLEQPVLFSQQVRAFWEQLQPGKEQLHP